MSSIEEHFKLLCEKKVEFIKNKNQIWIWGAGTGGKICLEVFEKHGIFVTGFIDAKADRIKNIYGKPVISIDEVDKNIHFVVISLMSIDQYMLRKLCEKGFTINDFCMIIEMRDPILDPSFKEWNEEEIVYNGCIIGQYTYGYRSLLEFPVAKSIGRFCSIHTSARVLANHPIDCITTSPILGNLFFLDIETFMRIDTYIKENGRYKNNALQFKHELSDNKPVVIGNDVWIGANVSILPGVTIGDGAILAAGAVITKNVEPYSIVGGVPAKLIKYRFDEKVRNALCNIQWWNWSIEKIKENLEFFINPSSFIEKFEKNS